MKVDIQKAEFVRQDGTGIVWEDYAYAERLPSPSGGTRDGALLIELGVDGWATCIYGQGIDRTLIEKALMELRALLDGLDDLYPVNQSRGRCLEHGDWGRCRLDDGHDKKHSFPPAPQGLPKT